MIADIIDTVRFVLRPLRVSDADEMVSVLAAASLYEFTGGEGPTLDILLERYRSQTTGSGRVGESWCNWIVRTRADDRPVGFVQATVVGAVADVAWLVGVDHQGCGVATEAAAAVSTWLGGKGVRRIEAHIHPRHAASQAVASRIGLSPTGRRDDDGEEIWSADTA